MRLGAWYRSYGHGSPQRYFEVVDIHNEDSVTLACYTFDPVTHRLSTPERRRMSMQEWLTEIAQNNILEISESHVPFLMSM